MDPLIKKQVEYNPNRFKQFTLAAAYEAEQLVDLIIETHPDEESDDETLSMVSVAFAYEDGLDIHLQTYIGFMDCEFETPEDVLRVIVYHVKTKDIRYQFLGCDAIEPARQADIKNFQLIREQRCCLPRYPFNLSIVYSMFRRPCPSMTLLPISTH